MTPLFLLSSYASIKKQVVIVAVVLSMLCFLPMLAAVALAGANPIDLIDPVYNGPTDPTDTYDFGNCTYWAALLRAQINEPIPNTWGNAATWAERAAFDGYLVDHTPSYGAIMQTPNAANGLGHVAFVKSVDPLTGSWTISEMNVKGWDVVDEQTLPASTARSYNFIHQKEAILSLPLTL